MNRSQLVDSVAEKSGLSKNDSSKAVKAFIDVVSEALANGDQVNLVGFGSFIVRERAARTGKNPRTGEVVQIAAAKAPAFKPGKGLKDALNK